MTGKEKRKSSSSSSSSSSDSEAESKDIKPSNDLVLTKYNMAAEIVNTVLKELISQIKEGAEVVKLCALGDERLIALTSKVFKNQKEVQKGIAMPTCISVDNCVCHFSPLSSDKPVVLRNDQLVKIEMGAHVDGYIAVVAHSLVIGASKTNKVTGKKANVILAAYNTVEAVLRMLRPEKGFKNNQVTEYITQISKDYGTNPIENMLSHEIERFKIMGNKQIIQNPADEQKSKMEKCEFENFEVYAIDILISSGEGKAKPHDTRTTIYKKTDDMNYSLKMKASRAFYSEAQQKFGLMPFALRLFDDEVKAKMGVLECERHGLMQPYQVIYEREGEFVAHFKTTAIIMPSGIFKITGFPLDMEAYQSNEKIKDETVISLLKESLKPKKKKPKKTTTVDKNESNA